MEEDFSDLSVGLANRCRQKASWWFKMNSCWETYYPGKMKMINNSDLEICFVYIM